jgi:HAD superfamily hydrolase (TIGR01509 family)
MAVETLPYDLVIFDCDGVLVDSEMLSANVLMQQFLDLGIALSFDDFRKYFLGRKFSVAVDQFTQRVRQPIPDNFKERYFDRLLTLFETDLKPMVGVQNMLTTMVVKKCVASSSLPIRLSCALRVCDLARFFEPNIFSAALVQHAKPAPDLFLHAARAMGVDPTRCLVIEDSAMGIDAARAAGMAIWHFTGGAHMHSSDLHLTEMKVERRVNSMRELQTAFGQIGVCRTHQAVV